MVKTGDKVQIEFLVVSDELNGRFHARHDNLVVNFHIDSIKVHTLKPIEPKVGMKIKLIPSGTVFTIVHISEEK